MEMLEDILKPGEDPTDIGLGPERDGIAGDPWSLGGTYHCTEQ